MTNFNANSSQHISNNYLLFSLLYQNPPASKNDDGFTVGTVPYEFGTCNGKLREIVNVTPGQTYKFRLINGGSHYAFRIYIEGFEMNIISADSEPVEPYKVDEVILHAAERFDVEIQIPGNLVNGDRFWIRADTLESAIQGYQVSMCLVILNYACLIWSYSSLTTCCLLITTCPKNKNGIRAILNVVHESADKEDIDYFQGPVMTVEDPEESISHTSKLIGQRSTMNCYSRRESHGNEHYPDGGACLSITELRSATKRRKMKENRNRNEPPFTVTSSSTEFHTVDFEFHPTPQHAHFVRIDNGLFLQHQNPMKAMTDPSFNPEYDHHPNAAIMHVKPFSSVVILWRNKSLMDHPMHLHGYKMEILAIDLPVRTKHCTLSKCSLNKAFDKQKLSKLDRETPSGSTVLKDTFILPAGGAVVTRVTTADPALWFAHCHIHTHRDDGMAFIMNVGNYTAPLNRTSLPNDFPSCDTPFIQTKQPQPACNCYINGDAVLDGSLTEHHRCSRSYLCYHEQSQAANLDSYDRNQYPVASTYKLSNAGITSIVLSIILTITILFTNVLPSWRGGDRSLDPYEGTKLRRHSRQNVVKAEDEVQRAPERTYHEISWHMIQRDTGADRSEQNTGSDSSYGSEQFHLQPDETQRVPICPKHVVEQPLHLSTQVDTIDLSMPTRWQKIKSQIKIDWKIICPDSINKLRTIEVSGLALLTGILFHDVGNDTSANGLSKQYSLLFFSTTLWTFQRMYPAIWSFNAWFKNLKDGTEGNEKNDLVNLCISRCIVMIACEGE